jgi:UDPglucose 6-dehydrogenase
MKKQRISIVGTGYVGLSTAVAFASKNYKVITSTHDAEKATMINKGIPPFHEPQLQEKLKEAVRNKLLKCMLNLEEAVLNADITFIATGTPSKLDGTINLQYIKKSANEIGKALKKKENYHVIVVKSTVTPGTTENTIKPTIETRSAKLCDVDFGLCMNPEFLRQGLALHDTLNPDRIVIGEHDKKSGDILEALYRDFHGKDTPALIRTNLQTAELIKYASNAFLATKISFINTIANLCEKIPSLDITTVAKAMGLDKRISPHFLNAGLGYGGSCFPKDLKALIAHAKKLGYTPELLEAVENVNEVQPYKAVQLCKNFLGDLKNKKIAILGLAFKPNTDDLREAKSITIINQLLKERANVTAYDPAAIKNAKALFKNKIKYASSAIHCIKNADCCILITEWDEFKNLTPEDFSQNMNQIILIDGRRIYNPQEFRKKLKFAAIGLGQ